MATRTRLAFLASCVALRPGAALCTRTCLGAPAHHSGLLRRSRVVSIRACSGEASEDPPPPFSQLDVRVGKIVEVWEHPDSDKLFCEKIDVGEAEPRQIASGLRAHYELADLEGRSVLVVCNLKPAKLAGFASSGMVFCASSADKSTVEFLDPPPAAAPGDRVLTRSEAGALGPPDEEGSLADLPEPASPNQMKKKKILDRISPNLKTDDDRVATYCGEALVVAGGTCTAKSVAGGSIS